MKGDFSRWAFDDSTNATGVLQQQGRLLLDADWNAQTRLTSRWQDQAARAAFGRAAAVSSARPDSLLIRSARVVKRAVELELEVGEVWADGVLAYLRNEAGADSGTVKRPAPHYGPPFHTAAELSLIAGSLGSSGTRDAVVLEVWREVVNGFQVPKHLIEPALGGVDTTERLQTSFRFRLVRLGDRETCEDLQAKLATSEELGRLSVTLQPVESKNGDCPVVEGGGYVGFEHNLYRIEIARTKSGLGAMFKWSQFNGGLVGRGEFDLSAGQRRLIVKHNRQAILRSGLEKFYLEVLAPVPRRSQALAERWEVKYGARVTLTDNELTLPATDDPDEIFGSLPETDRSYFFRLWNGIAPISAFSAPASNELHDGILVKFGEQGPYRAGDYWVFPVRAGEVKGDEDLIVDQPPEGVRRLRVPLGVLEWTGSPEGIRFTAGEIEDHRAVMPALSELKRGCSIAVLPGEDLHCALDSVKKAGGGCLCLLPGDHRINAPLDFSGASNITLKGFGLSSRLHAVWDMDDRPMFVLDGSSGVSFESFTVFGRVPAAVWSCQEAIGIDIRDMFALSEVSERTAPTILTRGTTNRDWRIENNVFLGGTAIEGARLTRTTVEGNVCLGARRGIHARELLDVRIIRNRFIGMSAKLAGTANNTIAKSGSTGSLAVRTRDTESSREVTDTLEDLIYRVLPLMEEHSRLEAQPIYAGVQCTAAFDVEISDNVIRSAGGAIFAEAVENGIVERNVIDNVTRGASLGAVHGLRFAANRIGDTNKDSAISPIVGLFVFGDSIDCRILDNDFRGVRNAIVFGSFSPGNEVVTSFASVLPASGDPIVAEEVGDAAMATAVASTNMVMASMTLWDPAFFRVGRCERTLIRGNRIDALDIGIGWFEGKNILDFRITANSFDGCAGGAILIEPHDWIHFVAEEVDTKVRLIDNNRFDIRGPAVRATSGAVRVEDNDIRLLGRFIANLAWGEFAGYLAKTVYDSDPYSDAVAGEDSPTMRMMTTEIGNAAAKDPGSVNTNAFIAGGREMLGVHMNTLTKDSAAFSLYTMSNVARHSPELLVATANTTLPVSTIQLERFVLNLTGHNNRVIDNRIQSANDRLDGGVILHTLSGEVTGNEIETGRYALALKTSASQPRQDLRIEGNTLRVTGPPSGQGKQPASYALAMPNLSPGNITILDNLFEGSVQLGAEPFSSLNLVTTGLFEFLPFLVNAHMINYDANTLYAGLNFAATAATEALPTPVAEPVVLGAVPLTLQLFEYDPHRQRAVVQFSDNRVVRGWAAIAPSTGGAFWNSGDLKNQAAKAPVVQVTGNVFDYWARVVGHELLLVGNFSQSPVQYRVGKRVRAVANIPQAKTF